MTLDIDLAALADILFGKVGELPPCHDVVPLGILPELAVAVAVAVSGGKGKGGYFGALAALGGSLVEVTYFRVSSNVTDKQDFIQRWHNPYVFNQSQI